MDAKLDKQLVLDIAIISKVVPWLLLVKDRPLDVHVRTALHDALNVNDGAHRVAFMRGHVTNMIYALGQQPNPEVVEAIVKETITQVDQYISAQYDDGLEGEPA